MQVTDKIRAILDSALREINSLNGKTYELILVESGQYKSIKIQFDNNVDLFNHVIQKVAAVNNLCDEDVIGNTVSRKKEFIQARAMLYAILRNRYRWSLNKIGEFVGGKDHSTVMNGLNAHDDMMVTDRWYEERFNSIEL